eukprot:gene40846-34458_t
MSEVMLELLHIPATIWFVIAVMSATNLIHMANIDLAEVTLLFSPFGIMLALFLLFFMGRHMSEVLTHGSGHSRITHIEFHEAGGNNGKTSTALPVPADIAVAGLAWEQNPHEEHPWSGLDGCFSDESFFNSCDPLDPIALERQIQMVILICCFYVGTIMMLTTLIINHMGTGLGLLTALVCWVLPLIPLFILIPRAILIYALVHRTLRMSRAWIKYALKEEDDPEEGGHGHGHGHGDDHGHGHDEEAELEALRERRKGAVDELTGVLGRHGDDDLICPGCGELNPPLAKRLGGMLCCGECGSVMDVVLPHARSPGPRLKLKRDKRDRSREFRANLP